MGLWKFILFIAIMLFSTAANAALLNFGNGGNYYSNEVLKKFIEDELDISNVDVSSFYYDIDNDSEKEIVGIIKHGLFYKINGYRLVVLKPDNDNGWSMLDTNVYFDPSMNLEIDNKVVTYYENHLGKAKKLTAKIQEDKISHKSTPKGALSNRRLARVEEVMRFSTNPQKEVIELDEFRAQSQKDVNIWYKNLDDRTKHYLDLK